MPSGVRLLLDTHVWIWAASNPDRLSPEVRDAIVTGSEVVVSAVVALEVAIKQALGKLDPSPALLESPTAHSFDTLAVTWAHAAEVAALPPHHRDPFDRLLVAQARIEGLTLVTADGLLSRYDVAIMPA